MGMLQRFVGTTIIDKTDLKGLADFAIRFSQEGQVNPDGLPLPPPPTSIAAPGARRARTRPPIPFHPFSPRYRTWPAIGAGQGPVEVLVVESVQKADSELEVSGLFPLLRGRQYLTHLL